MTDRLKGLEVALVTDIREDDAADIIAAVEMIKGVLSVRPLIATSDDWIARETIRRELIGKLYEVLK